MNKVKDFTVLFFLFSFLLLGGCANNTGIISLHLPESVPVEPFNGTKIYVESVVDDRGFQDLPDTRDLPTLGLDGDKVDAGLRLRAIGHNGEIYGNIKDDIFLDEGENVETAVRKALNRAFAESGYGVIEDRNLITADTIMLNVKIEKFWAYIVSGFWVNTISCDIVTEIGISAPNPSKVTVSVHYDGKYPTASDKNWNKAIDSSLAQYVEEVKNDVKP